MSGRGCVSIPKGPTDGDINVNIYKTCSICFHMFSIGLQFSLAFHLFSCQWLWVRSLAIWCMLRCWSWRHCCKHSTLLEKTSGGKGTLVATEAVLTVPGFRDVGSPMCLVFFSLICVVIPRENQQIWDTLRGWFVGSGLPHEIPFISSLSSEMPGYRYPCLQLIEFFRCWAQWATCSGLCPRNRRISNKYSASFSG